MSVIVPRFVENGDLLKNSFSPYAQIRINQANKFARGLLVCVAPQTGNGLNTVNLVDGKEPSIVTGNIAVDTCPFGKELQGSNGALAYDVTGLVSSPLSVSQFSLMKRRVDDNANMALFSFGSTASTNDRMEVHCRGQTAGDPYNAFYKAGGVGNGIRQGSMPFDGYMPIMYTRYSTSNYFLNVVDGAFQATSGLNDITVNVVSFMGHLHGGAVDAVDTSSLLNCFWDRPLSQSDIEEFFRDPLQLFEFV